MNWNIKFQMKFTFFRIYQKLILLLWSMNKCSENILAPKRRLLKKLSKSFYFKLFLYHHWEIIKRSKNRKIHHINSFSDDILHPNIFLWLLKYLQEFPPSPCKSTLVLQKKSKSRKQQKILRKKWGWLWDEILDLYSGSSIFSKLWRFF